ncbi:TetR/AcrR family transcriptional regulator [Mumia zhuanghuii]|uniref:TetR/AcrR family transcriptional regulator n=2 Tax=Mumia TaxID=1546255 RepID=A0ABW1QSV5_9ACTN|nr:MULTISPECIES: TetR/AcrR family transcriptional regulator [Mumia]KAA1423893.1 TetR/AcrR family transcriptional regulator [Mumia zhuanghuii]
MATRTRLSPDQRREQLLAHGARLFATQSYDDVHIERVAEIAEVSRGLLYHYFPNKRAFFAALLERAATHLAESTAPDPAHSAREQLYTGIESYLDHCRANRLGMRTIHRGAASADPDIQAIIERSTRLHEQRILAALEPDEPHPLLTITVSSWIPLLRAATFSWLDTPGTPAASRDEVRDLCVGALIGALSALPDAARPARLAELVDPVG